MAKSDKIIHCSVIGIVTLGGIALLYCGCNGCGLEGDRTAGFDRTFKDNQEKPIQKSLSLKHPAASKLETNVKKSSSQ